MLSGHPETVAAMVGFAVLGVFFVAAWAAVKREPAAKKAVERDQPPQGVSAAASRFLREQGKYDHLCFTAALLDLESHGAIGIDKHDSGITLHAETAPVSIPGPEGELVRALFAGGDSIPLAGGDAVRHADAALQTGLERDFRATHLQARAGPVAILLGAGLVTLGIVIFLGRENWRYLVASACAAVLLMLALGLGRSVARRLDVGAPRTYLEIGLAAISIAAAAFLVRYAYEEGSVLLPFMLAGVGVVMYCADALCVPTEQGRRTLDEIEGYLDHLKRGEDPLGSAERLFRAGLPYAVAAGIEKGWVERLDIARAVQDSSYDASFTGRLAETVKSATSV